jgi:hypothetical protein
VLISTVRRRKCLSRLSRSFSPDSYGFCLDIPVRACRPPAIHDLLPTVVFIDVAPRPRLCLSPPTMVSLLRCPRTYFCYCADHCRITSTLASNLRAQAAIAPILASSVASGSNTARHLQFSQSCSFPRGTVWIKPPALPEPSQMQSANASARAA